jgi:TonB-linked SusC/RagA family outer membrane protein
MSFITRRAGAMLVGAALVSLVATSAGLAQAGDRIAGIVTDARARPLEAAQVRVVGSTAGAATNSTGQFRIENVPGPTVTIRVTRIGYDPLTRTVRVGDTGLRLAMNEVAVNLDAMVVTGTAGGAERRSVGNAVAQVGVPEVVETAPVRDVGQLLNARAPGVVLMPPGGLASGGSRILIRGRSSFSLSTDPIVYVDGVRVDARGPTGGNGFGAASRLNDFSPEDIESIEIIKGPAAATLYGTEASTGVIQIITKKGRPGPPKFDLSIQQGDEWFNDYQKRWLVSYYHDPTQGGSILGFNLAQVESDAGRPLFRSGYMQGYGLGVRGGTETMQYYGSSTYNNDQGAQFRDAANNFSGRLNLALTPQATNWDASSQFGVTLARNNLADGGNLMFNSVLNRPLNRYTASRGFYTAPSEVWRREYLYDQNVDRITAGVEVRHRPASWLSHRLRTGLDLDNQDNIILAPDMLPQDAQFFSALAASGSKSVAQTHTLHNTIDYSATATVPIRSNLTAATTGGFQYYRTNTELLNASGKSFPSRDVTSLTGAAQTLGSDDQVQNTTVGGFGQEQLAWRDRLFLTGAIRFDRNSAFGAQFKSVAYPKVSASWVVNEEPFWHLSAINVLRLRGAYGASGQQPQAFAALRTFEPVTGQAGAPAVTPQFVGNPNLGPEKSHELELGFETSLFNNRLGLDFTHYDKRTNDAIVLRDVAPSTGFPAQQFINVGAIGNTGYEMLFKARPVESPGAALDMTLNLSANDNKVLSLGLANTPYLEFGFGNRFQPGFPVYAFFARKVVSADHGPNGTIINIKCDGGNNFRQGGPPVDCATAPRVYIGRPDPNVEGSFTSSLTIRNRLTVSGMVDFKRGQRTWSSSLWCPGILGCYEKLYPDKVDAVVAASSVLGYTDDARWEKDLSFAKLREISVNYLLPDRLAKRYLGSDRASISLAARNLHTWTKFEGLDPENVALFGDLASFGTQFEQNELPQLMSFVAKLNITF